HVKIDFELFKYGIIKRRLLEGEPETSDEWTTGHPLLFPNILAVGGHDAPMLQYRVPIDDTHTIQFGYRTTSRKQGAAARPIVVKHSTLYNDAGKIIADNVPAQDMTAWVGQGPISDRTREHLATSDRGVALYHKLLMEQMDAIERGEEPMALVRDPSENEPMIEIGREQRGVAPAFESEYDNYFAKIEAQAQIRAK
ncbi:MAG TPA: hypothetical protein VHY80_20595, partial [Stellaceae bacterium]|nr:hypothetical protein [Stellaceae bacterium]